MQLVLASFGYVAGGWRVERHPRFLADLTGDGRADVVGFGNAGVSVALNNGNGTFGAQQLAVPNFGYVAGGWRVERHPRFLADLTGDGRADVVGFGDEGVYVALNNGNGTFGAQQLAVPNFGYAAGGWRVERHPRFLADLTGDGRADVVGFGNAGVYVALNNGNGTFGAQQLVVPNFGYVAGGWRIDRHPRVVADVTGDARADIVGFGDAGVYTSLNKGDGTFATTRVRRDIHELESAGPWDPTTLAYANAVRALRQRPATDPTSWTYLAAVHGTTAPVPRGATWNACQHGSWYFLPWHRMYLYYFERIVRAEVVAQGGPADWALPYWDYDSPGQASLPPAFRQTTLPDGSPNPLFVSQRNSALNAGGLLPPSATTSAAAMAATRFVPTFGGGITTPQHFFGAAGELEFTPHNIVHSLISGWMGDPDTAALDPIFWLHHCNVDRLWEAWLNRGGTRANPTQAQWLAQSFVFHDEDGASVTLTGADVVDTAVQLEYTYERLVRRAPAVRAEVAGGRQEGTTDMPSDEPEAEREIVGASQEPVELAGAPASVGVQLDRRALRARATAAAPRDREQVFLNLEDIRGDENPSIGYEVFVRSAGETPHYVGTVSFFGIQHASVAGPDVDGPHGLRRTFDITPLVATLRDRGEWNDQDLTVTFRPLGVIAPTAEAARRDEADVEQPTVRIGRVSVFYGQ